MMPRLGAHMSVAGGLYKSVERIMAVNGQALQIFTRNQRQWRSAPVSDSEVRAFMDARNAWGDWAVASHASYLINLATPDEQAGERAAAALGEELVRSQRLSIPFVVLHPGAHMGRSERGAARPCGEPEEDGGRTTDAGDFSGPVAAGIRRVAERLTRVLESVSAPGVRVLLENTAGQGTALGARLEELGAILRGMDDNPQIGVCLDTAHAFAAGYDLRTRAGYDAMFAAVHREMPGRLSLMHLNDSRVGCGSRVDRHAHIGLGELGETPFAWLMRDPALAHVPMVLETPKDDTLEDDRRNLEVLRRLAETA